MKILGIIIISILCIMIRNSIKDTCPKPQKSLKMFSDNKNRIFVFVIVACFKDVNLEWQLRYNKTKHKKPEIPNITTITNMETVLYVRKKPWIWVVREVGRIWEVLSWEKNMFKIHCMKTIYILKLKILFPTSEKGYFFLSRYSIEFYRLPGITIFIIGLCYLPPELDCKTLLLKIPYTWVIEHKKM